MRAIAVRHRITNHFTAQLELDMAAAGINDSIASCPISPGGLFADQHGMPSVKEPNTFTQGPSGDITFTKVIEDLTRQSVADGFGKKGSNELRPSGAMPGGLPYIVGELKRRQEELNADQSAWKSSNGRRTESETAMTSHMSRENDFRATSDPYCPFDQAPSAATGGTPSSDSSSSNAMPGNSNTMQSNSKTTQYPYRHVDPSNRGSKPYGIFQADHSSYQDSPGWGMQDVIGGFDNSDQGRNNLQDEFSGFDNNGQSGVDFHDFIGDRPWNPGPMPE
jgi:hypothetical protein